jgi:four helix bundle protein
MDEREFKERTKKLGLAVIHLSESLVKTRAADVIARQVLRSATSIGANYRSACRAKSAADMLNKLKIVEEEGDETIYWLELLKESRFAPDAILDPLIKETDEIVAMTVASIKTIKSKIQNPRS